METRRGKDSEEAQLLRCIIDISAHFRREMEILRSLNIVSARVCRFIQDNYERWRAEKQKRRPSRNYRFMRGIKNAKPDQLPISSHMPSEPPHSPSELPHTSTSTAASERRVVVKATFIRAGRRRSPPVKYSRISCKRRPFKMKAPVKELANELPVKELVNELPPVMELVHELPAVVPSNSVLRRLLESGVRRKVDPVIHPAVSQTLCGKNYRSLHLDDRGRLVNATGAREQPSLTASQLLRRSGEKVPREKKRRPPPPPPTSPPVAEVFRRQVDEAVMQDLARIVEVGRRMNSRSPEKGPVNQWTPVSQRLQTRSCEPFCVWSDGSVTKSKTLLTMDP